MTSQPAFGESPCARAKSLDMAGPDIEFLTVAGVRIAYRRRLGGSPTLLFLPGYASDMDGTKGDAFDAFAAKRGLAMVRFDYSGTGASHGEFAEGTLDGWLDQALAVVDKLTSGPLIPIGSSIHCSAAPSSPHPMSPSTCHGRSSPATSCPRRWRRRRAVRSTMNHRSRRMHDARRASPPARRHWHSAPCPRTLGISRRWRTTCPAWSRRSRTSAFP